MVMMMQMMMMMIVELLGIARLQLLIRFALLLRSFLVVHRKDLFAHTFRRQILKHFAYRFSYSRQKEKEIAKEGMR